MDLRYSLRGHQHPVTSLHILPKHLVSGDEAGFLFVWSLETRRPLLSFQAFDQGSVMSLCSVTVATNDSSSSSSSSSSSCIIMAQSRQNLIYFYRFRALLEPAQFNNWAQIKSQQLNKEEELAGTGTVPHPILALPCESLFFCGCKARGTKVAFTLSSPSRLCIYSIPLTLADTSKENEEHLAENLCFINLPSGASSCLCLDFVQDHLVITGHEDGSLHLHDLVSQTTIRQFSQRHSQVLLSIAVLSDTLVISGGADDYLYIHNVQESDSKEEQVIKKSKINLKAPGVSSVCVFDGCIVACCWSGDIVLYNLETGKILDEKREHRKSLRCAAFSSLATRSWTSSTTSLSGPDSVGKTDDKMRNFVFIGSEDCRISCWTFC